jgi:hypothetical protein
MNQLCNIYFIYFICAFQFSAFRASAPPGTSAPLATLFVQLSCTYQVIAASISLVYCERHRTSLIFSFNCWFQIVAGLTLVIEQVDKHSVITVGDFCFV